ncbi:MAG: CheE protein [Phenylobacterium sp.]|nr:CheE protein [Phenylobacterium sp.]
MTSVRFVFPKPRLNELLRMPGGLPVAEALERAQKNLEAIKPTCTAELLALLELCEASYWNLKDAYDEPAVTELYSLAVKGIGAGEVCGVPSVDIALTSFCDLLDHLRTLKRYDHDAVGVHVRAWRLLMGAGLPAAGAEQILDGLLKVSRRYSAEARATSAA